MKILFTITGLGMGGAENQVVNLADELAFRGHSVTVAHIIKPALVLPKNQDIRVVWLGGTGSGNGKFKSYLSLVKLIKQEKPDVLHSHMIHANLLSRLTRLVTKVPRLICTAHSINEGGTLRMLVYRLTDFLADEFTNVSQEAVDNFETKRAVPCGKMFVTHNGINMQRFKFDVHARNRIRSEYNLEKNKVFVAIGRFHEAKDYPNLLDAFKITSQRLTNAHLLIVGDGKLRSLIEQQISELKLNGKVTLLGVRNDVPDILSASDIFVLSSAWEGFGLVAAEAMACERIAVATNCGGVAEVLGGNGYLVEPKNSEMLAECMEAAANLPAEIAKDYGAKARQHVEEKFSLNSAVDRWLKIYKGNFSSSK